MKTTMFVLLALGAGLVTSGCSTSPVTASRTPSSSRPKASMPSDSFPQPSWSNTRKLDYFGYPDPDRGDAGQRRSRFSR